MMTKLSTAIVLGLAVFCGGCAPARHSFEEEGAYDPIEPINRAVYGFNKKVDFFALRPAAKIYSNLPPPVQTATGNFLSHLGEPKNIANYALQGRADDAARAAARLVFNTFFGLGGMADVADKMGIAKKSTGFGDTIRTYVGNGAYLVLPVFGPSSVSDAPGLVADAAASPAAYVESSAFRTGVGVSGAVSTRAEFLQYEYLLEGTLDEYTYVRDVREEFRRKKISAGGFLGGGEDN